MNLSTILWVSVALQVFAAIYALRLIPISGRLLAWSILSFAFFLMATRRAISLLYREGYIQNEMFQALTAESVALLISTLIVAGVILIKKIFVEHEKNINEIKTLSQVVEQNPVSTIIASPKGKIQYANLGFLSFMGLSRNDCIGKNIETIHSDCATGLENGAIDVVLLYDTYHDVTNPDGVLEELHRVLKPDSVLSLTDHHMKEDEILSQITRNNLFVLSRKGKKTYSFSKI